MSFFLLDHNFNFLFRLPPYLLKVEATKKMPLGWIGEQTVYSFDLQSATDRWPLLFLYEVFTHLFDLCFGSHLNIR